MRERERDSRVNTNDGANRLSGERRDEKSLGGRVGMEA